MTTRLAHYCDRVLEACWLAVALLTPVFFDVYSSRAFEPDKLTLLRSIALLMAAAWLIRTLEGARDIAAAAGGGQVSARDLWRALGAAPLVPQILLLVAVYLLATVLSVVPRTSFWGSYQRLQGTYTTVAYVVIFFVTWQALRSRAQLDRLLNTIVIASLPVALYGVLQHFGLDPLPWAGDVRDRVTGNLGNAIFMGAYLMMAAFITLERTLARFRRLLSSEGSTPADAFVGAGYLFILALQALAIYFTKSRGPWMGLLAGIYFFVLIALVALRRSAEQRGPLRPAEAGKALALALLSPAVGALPAYLALILARRGRRWLWLSWCLQAVLAMAFLIVFNLPASPLAPLRQVPGIGRLGQVFETEGGTGRVRVLIWQGAVELLASNPLRALVGYGPESMFVAFNPAYPPDLAHYESRRATPDRSHNETFDALLTTGVAGFLVYIALFVGIFFYGLRWLGLLPPPGQRRGLRRLFLGLTAAGGVLGVLVPLLVDRSLRFAGVGIPVGLIGGAALYVAVAAVVNPEAPPTVRPPGGTRSLPDANPIPPDGGTVGGPRSAAFGDRELLLASLLGLVVAHFVEIHFGIAIAATRLYFWLALALLVSAGTGRLSLAPAAPTPAAQALERQRHGGRRQVRSAAAGSRPRAAPAVQAAGPLAGAALAGVLGALLLGTVIYGFTINTTADLNPLRVIWSALTTLRLPGQSPAYSPGVLALCTLTWLLGAIWVVGEAEHAERRPSRAGWLRGLGLYAALSLGGALLFATISAAQLQPGSDLGLMIYLFYAFALGAILLAAALLPGPRAEAPLVQGRLAVLYPVLGGATLLMIWSNATVVRADIYFKQAWDRFHLPVSQAVAAGTIDRATALRNYDAALYYYQQALTWAPEEDYYLLFEGKALLERSEIAGDPQTRLRNLQESEAVLKQAQALSPLNTDHTANLARLYRSWANASTDAAARQARLEEAARYFEQSTRLSPHNAALFDEWGQTLADLGRPEEALARYRQSLALDQQYAQTYLLLADYYLSQKDTVQAGLNAARAAEVDPASGLVRASVGDLYTQIGRLDDAIQEYQQALVAFPQDYTLHKALAIVYGRLGQIDRALEAANAARALAPESARGSIDQLIAQLQGQAKQGQP